MTINPTKPIAALLCVGLFAACAADPESGSAWSDTEELGGKADGFTFVRAVEPIAAGSETIAGTFDPAKYAAFSTSLASEGYIRMSLVYTGWAYWRDVLASSVFLEDPPAAPLLFKRDPSAAGDAKPEDKWDLVTRANGPTWAHVAAGEYMIVFLVSPEAYVQRLTYDASIETAEPGIGTQEPAAITFKIHRRDGSPKSDYRVAVGTVAGRTDRDGVVSLRGLDPVRQVMKFGETGTDPVLYPTDTSVELSSGFSLRELVIVDK